MDPVSDKEENSPNGKTESLQNEESSSSVQDIPSIAVSESPIEHFDSIVSLEKTISNFEENTKSNFIILQKSKNFGDEDFKASGKEKILWKSQNVKGSVHISFSGIPYVIVGRKTLQCHLGKDLNCHKTKKYEEKRCKKRQKIITFKDKEELYKIQRKWAAEPKYT